MAKTLLKDSPKAAGRKPLSGNILILDFGSQYTQLIARRLREMGYYSEIAPGGKFKPGPGVGALILSGGPASVYDEGAPQVSQELLETGLPILGICYGLQALSKTLGGKVVGSNHREYGFARLLAPEASDLLAGVPEGSQIWMSHGDRLEKIPQGFSTLAKTENCPHAAIGDSRRRIYGLQFHPEVVHTERGVRILENFLTKISGLAPNWSVENFIEGQCEALREKVGNRRILLALSGGVDSSVLAMLLERALPGQTDMRFVDTGLLTAGERDRVERLFGKFSGFRTVEAKDRFLSALSTKTDPESKRKAIGRTFIEVFEDEAKNLNPVPDFLAQGTLYSDRIESFGVGGASATIKSHHNVGGLPERLGFELLEPLSEIFKDEVRAVGRKLGLEDEIVGRHPLPGPALGIRCIGEITEERLEAVRNANRIVEEEIRAAGLYNNLWQAFAVLLPVRSVGVMGDRRTHQEVCSVRAVTSQDAMTAEWEYLPRDVLARISSRIVNETPGINRVLFDITSKPPGTIEWE